MIVLNKNSIHSVISSKVEDFWKSYRDIEFFVWKNISKVGFDKELKSVVIKNHMHLSIVVTEKDYLIVYLIFKDEILLPLKIQKFDRACKEYLKSGDVVPTMIKIFGFPKPFL